MLNYDVMWFLITYNEYIRLIFNFFSLGIFCVTILEHYYFSRIKKKNHNSYEILLSFLKS